VASFMGRIFFLFKVFQAVRLRLCLYVTYCLDYSNALYQCGAQTLTPPVGYPFVNVDDQNTLRLVAQTNR